MSNFSNSFKWIMVSLNKNTAYVGFSLWSGFRCTQNDFFVIFLFLLFACSPIMFFNFFSHYFGHDWIKLKLRFARVLLLKRLPFTTSKIKLIVSWGGLPKTNIANNERIHQSFYGIVLDSGHIHVCGKLLVYRLFIDM